MPAEVWNSFANLVPEPVLRDLRDRDRGLRERDDDDSSSEPTGAVGGRKRRK